jgi:hypothetical protein
MLADNHDWIDITLWIWFSLTALSAIYIAWDLITRTPEMKVMKWGCDLCHALHGAGCLHRVLVLLSRTRARNTRDVHRAALEAVRRLNDSLHGGRRDGHHCRGGDYQPAWVANGRRLLAGGQRYVAPRVAIDEHSNGRHDPGDGYPDDAGRAGEAYAALIIALLDPLIAAHASIAKQLKVVSVSIFDAAREDADVRR